MAYDSWACIMVRKGPGMIDEDTKATLIMAACDLKRKNRDRMGFKGDACGGLIESSWKTHLVGTCRGILFRASVMEEKDDYEVNFLLSDSDLENGARQIQEARERGEKLWHRGATAVPCQALYRFLGSHAPKTRN